MALPTSTEEDIYRGDTLVLIAVHPAITFTEVKSQIRQTEDSTAYFDADTIVNAGGVATVTFGSATASLLDATKKYVMDVQFKDAAGFVVTTQKYTLTITKDVTRVFGTLTPATENYANFAALPAIGVAVVGTIYKTIDDGALWAKPNSSSTAYAAYF